MRGNWARFWAILHGYSQGYVLADANDSSMWVKLRLGWRWGMGTTHLPQPSSLPTISGAAFTEWKSKSWN